MNADTWQQLKNVFHAAIELAPEGRTAFLKKSCDGDNELRARVDRLLTSHDEAGAFLVSPAVVDAGVISADGQARVTDEEQRVGQRIGPYEITRELGHGGMGSVFLAVRADDQYRKQVAIKLVNRGMDTDLILRRFMMERQILANLEHPNIARLLEGGSTLDGLPYFVMEFIEGQPITEYCDARRFTNTERLELFRQVCAALQYAHQNLVVHRDIKPSNILVTPEGVPKLLDFGIAKLLSPGWDAETAEATASTVRLMTPEYASPEQFRGISITTASDVYSLGVVLYELLSGHHPHRLTNRQPEEVARVILRDEPEKPSTVGSRQSAIGRKKGAHEVDAHEQRTTDNGQLADKTNPQSAMRGPQPGSSAGVIVPNPKSLRGDLDNIVLKALRKEPERRYASVQEFSEDIRRHLEGLPVTASPDTFGYRARKFTQRHKAGVLAASIVVITLLTATVITSWQARVARRERDKAERRFDQVRKLANSVLFEYHDGIEKLPGSTPVRQMLVQDALQYLDNLSKESGNDVGLQREIAAAYQKVGDVQGNPTSANLGDLAGALDSYQKALALREKLAAAGAENAGARRDLAVTYSAIADALIYMFQFDKATDNYHKAIVIVEGIVSVDRNDLVARRNLWMYYRKLGRALVIGGDLKNALTFVRKAQETNALILAADPSSPQTRKELALTEISLGELLAEMGDVAGALVSSRKALAIDQELLSTDPTDTNNHFDVATDYLNIGEAIYDSGDVKNALENYRKALQILESVELADPKNARAKYQLAVGYKVVGQMLAKTGNQLEAIESYRKCSQIFDDLVQLDPANVRSKGSLAWILSDLGVLLAKSGDSAGALKAGQRSLAIAEQLASAEQLVARSLIVTVSCSGLGNIHAIFAADARHNTSTRLAEWREARKWFQRSMDIWTSVKASGKFIGIEYGSQEQVQKDLDRCDAALAKLRPYPKESGPYPKESGLKY